MFSLSNLLKSSPSLVCTHSSAKALLTLAFSPKVFLYTLLFRFLHLLSHQLLGLKTGERKFGANSFDFSIKKGPWILTPRDVIIQNHLLNANSFLEFFPFLSRNLVGFACTLSLEVLSSFNNLDNEVRGILSCRANMVIVASGVSVLNSLALLKIFCFSLSENVTRFPFMWHFDSCPDLTATNVEYGVQAG